MDNFLSKQNKGLIWDILDENLTIDINYKPEVYNLLESNFVPFYEKEKHPGNYSRPRKYEIAAAINRIRTLKIIFSSR